MRIAAVIHGAAPAAGGANAAATPPHDACSGASRRRQPRQPSRDADRDDQLTAASPVPSAEPGSPARSTSATAGAPASAAASTPIAASSIWARDPSCSAPTSPSPIPSTACSTRSTCAPTTGATSRIGPSISTPKKAKLYDFNADYRDIAYFNNLPSYADPLLARGIVLDEQSFDTRRHIGTLFARPAAGKLVHSVLRLRSRFRAREPA